LLVVLGQHQPHVVTQRQVVAVNVNLDSAAKTAQDTGTQQGTDYVFTIRHKALSVHYFYKSTEQHRWFQHR
jgi:hypothetical protein